MHTSTAGNLATIVVRERNCENPSYARQCAVRQRKPPADGLTVFRRPADGESARPGGPRPAFFENAFFENAFFENAFFENFANVWRALSRLYQNEILQENMRLTPFF